MKTLKDVVDEIGLPVYCVLVDGSEAIIETSVGGGYLATMFMKSNGTATSFGDFCFLSTEIVTFYQSLKEACSPITPVHYKVNMDTCKCPTLLAGHHAECQWKP